MMNADVLDLLNLLQEEYYHIAGASCRLYINGEEGTFSVFSSGATELERMCPLYYGTDVKQAIKIFKEVEGTFKQDFVTNIKRRMEQQ